MASGLAQAFAALTGLALGASSANAKAETKKAEEEAKLQTQKDAINLKAGQAALVDAKKRGDTVAYDAAAELPTVKKFLSKEVLKAGRAETEAIGKQIKDKTQRFEAGVRRIAPGAAAQMGLEPSPTGAPGLTGLPPTTTAPPRGLPAPTGAPPSRAAPPITATDLPPTGAQPSLRPAPRTAVAQAPPSGQQRPIQPRPGEVPGPVMRIAGQTVEAFINPDKQTITFRVKETGMSSNLKESDGKVFNVITDDKTGEVVSVREVKGVRASSKDRDKAIGFLDAVGVSVNPQTIEYAKVVTGSGGEYLPEERRIFRETLEQMGIERRKREGLPSRGLPVFAEVFKEAQQIRLRTGETDRLVKTFGEEGFRNIWTRLSTPAGPT